MVYDCFMVYDEMDMLEIRLNILAPVVDYFVITEATTTQIGSPKEMYYDKNRKRFVQFQDKIIYNVVDMAGMVFPDQWHREVFQKDHCIDGLKDAHDDDIIIFSDLDEIPNPDAVRKVVKEFDESKIYHFAQDMYYFFINYKSIDGKLLSSTGEFPGIKDKKWLGTKICSYKTIKRTGFDALRHKEMINENAVRIPDGGWHFTYMGGTGAKVHDRVKKKLSAFSHAEYNKWRYYNRLSIWLSIVMGKDLLGRDTKFKKVGIDENYPEWLRDNCPKYKHFIL